jgi:hypothetical protein
MEGKVASEQRGKWNIVEGVGHIDLAPEMFSFFLQDNISGVAPDGKAGDFPVRSIFGWHRRSFKNKLSDDQGNLW